MATERQLRSSAKPVSAAQTKRNRPSRILNTAKKAITTNAMYEQTTMRRYSETNDHRSAQVNSTQSSLLSLTPEIRNRIYGLVLGRNTIHVCRDRYYDNDLGRMVNTTGHSLCCADTPDEEAVQAIRHTEEEFEVQSYEERHRQCSLRAEDRAGRHRIDLSILQTCSQIHREAALVPFLSNTFAAEWGSSEFFKRLAPIQCRSVTSMSYHHCDAPFDINVSPSFGGLKKLSILLELEADDVNWIGEKFDEGRPAFFVKAGSAARRSLESVTVASLLMDLEMPGIPPCTKPKLLRPLSKAFEEELLRKTSEAAKDSLEG